MTQMAQNMYRVGDYVYFETGTGAPLQIRRIDELNKFPTGNVEAKVSCFYRRRDVPAALLKIADKAERRKEHEDVKNALEQQPPTTSNGADQITTPLTQAPLLNGDVKVEGEESRDEDTNIEQGTIKQKSPQPQIKEDVKEKTPPPSTTAPQDDDTIGYAGLPAGAEKLSPTEIHLLRCRELFLSRIVETLPATHIRGKCQVTLLSEVESPSDYLDREDAFFYSLVFDPNNMTLLADKGSVRHGEKYQVKVEEWTGPIEYVPDAVLPNGGSESGEGTTKKEVPLTDRETLVFHPYHHLEDKDIDQFLIISKAVGTFARALDATSSAKIPSVHMTAASASRDVTLLHAMALLHQADYDIGKAVKFLVPPPSRDAYPIIADKATGNNTMSLGGPILCRDQMEEWSPYEANLFEEGMDKLGKDFREIRQVCVPWKSMRDIIEYYYMWKTTNRYVEIKKSKSAEKDHKLKQVYIPNYNKPSPQLASPAGTVLAKGANKCESCEKDEAGQWYNWGPTYLCFKVCGECWNVWKKCGGLKIKHPNELFDLDKKVETNRTNFDFNSIFPSVGATPAISSGYGLVNIKNGINILPGKGGQSQIIAQLPPPTFLDVKPMNGNSESQSKRASFFWQTDVIYKLARKIVPKDLFDMKKLSRNPFRGVDFEPALIFARDAYKKNPGEVSVIVTKWKGGSNITQNDMERMIVKRGIKRSADEDPSPPVKRPHLA
uniref:Metastasis-associated protein MTA3 n=1 Tax=Rhabditophanes sp. KR3021 TaxID=114890 RepID=A0AC35U1K0_9BILA